MSKIKIINQTEIDSLGTVSKIVHCDNYRKTYLFNDKNKTNYYTITKELKNDDTYILSSKLEIGEKYVSYFRYDKEGDLIYERRFNKIIKTTNIKELFIKNENGYIFINEYKKIKSINFKIKTNGKQQ